MPGWSVRRCTVQLRAAHWVVLLVLGSCREMPPLRVAPLDLEPMPQQRPAPWRPRAGAHVRLTPLIACHWETAWHPGPRPSTAAQPRDEPWAFGEAAHCAVLTEAQEADSPLSELRAVLRACLGAADFRGELTFTKAIETALNEGLRGAPIQLVSEEHGPEMEALEAPFLAAARAGVRRALASSGTANEPLVVPVALEGSRITKRGPARCGEKHDAGPCQPLHREPWTLVQVFIAGGDLERSGTWLPRLPSDPPGSTRLCSEP